MIDPNDFVITRKRKKYKFAKFTNAPNCVELEDWKKQPADVIELGAGTGLFSVELAAQNPNQRFVAVDVKADRLQKGAYAALDQGLDNIIFLRARADQLAECVRAKSLDAVWLTFPDPFPRPRSARRRLTHPLYLDLYQKLLKAGGPLYVKHDSETFFTWTLEQLVACSWRIEELSFDLHASDLSDEYKIETTYEKRWRTEGSLTRFVKASPPPVKRR